MVETHEQERRQLMDQNVNLLHHIDYHNIPREKFPPYDGGGA